MTLGEIIALTKAGYKKTDIDKMIEEEKKEPEKKEPEKKEPEKKEPEKEPEQEPEQEPEKEPEKEPETDYKKLYEESQSKLKEAQAHNSKEDIKGKVESPEELLSKFIADFR